MRQSIGHSLRPSEILGPGRSRVRTPPTSSLMPLPRARKRAISLHTNRDRTKTEQSFHMRCMQTPSLLERRVCATSSRIKQASSAFAWTLRLVPKARRSDDEQGNCSGAGETSQMKLCPSCSQEIQDAALRCRYCKNWLITSGGGGDPYSAGVPYASTTTSGMAIASMVLGIVWIYWTGSIVALVLG